MHTKRKIYEVIDVTRIFNLSSKRIYTYIFIFFFFFSNPRGCLNIHRASSRKITFAEMRVLLLRPHEILYSAATRGCRRRTVNDINRFADILTSK